MGQLPVVWISFVIIVVGAILHSVGLATPQWTVWPRSDLGPFLMCNVQGCETTDSSIENLVLVRVMTILGVALAGVAGVSVLLLAIISDRGKTFDRVLVFIACGTGCACFLFIVIGGLVWVISVHSATAHLGYSFALTLVGGALVAFGSFLTCCRGRRRPTY